MGYDMRMVRIPEGEAEEVARIRKVYDEAIKVRDALPREERGTLTREELKRSWDTIPANASLRYRVAQNEVLRLSDAWSGAERSYFRLNIWGMGNVREAMFNLGMVYESATESPWPDYPEEIEHVIEALREDEPFTEYLAKYYPEKPAPGETEIEQARKYITECDALLRAHPEGGTTIPVHKFGSNDGWIVTPGECLEALAAWHSRSEEERTDTLASAGITGEKWVERWMEWLGFLELAAQHEGFEVH